MGHALDRLVRLARDGDGDGLIYDGTTRQRPAPRKPHGPMKRREVLDALAHAARAAGKPLQVTEGGNHTKVRIGSRQTVVPRHNVVNAWTAQAILKHMEAL
jgi:mRNA interferase HicA